MNKKLTAKVQQLNAQASPESIANSSAIVIEPEEQNQILKKGSIYGVFNVSSNNVFDFNLVKTVIYDVLRESYYQTDSISPVQSLEKAILDVKEKVTHVVLKEEEQKVEFNIICGVLWGSVLYVVQFGGGKSFLVRQGEIKEIKTMSEGSFSAASGVIKDEDVVIFGTQQFCDTYPPHKLLSMAIPEQSLQPLESGLLMKFIVDTNFTENEIVDFGLPEEVKAKSKKKKPLKILPKINLANTFKKLFGFVAKIKTKKAPVEQQTTSIRLKQRAKPILTPKVLIPIALGALLVTIFFTLRYREMGIIPSETEEETYEENIVIEPEVLDGTVENEEPEEPEEPAEAVFYDIKITDASAEPQDIEVFNTYLVTTDRNSGKIYTSLRDTPKFEPIEETAYSGINSLENSGGGELFFADNEGYKFYDLNDFALTESYSAEPGTISSTYLGFIYTIKEDSLIKYTASGGELTEDTWATSDDFRDAKGLAVAFNVYVLTNNGEVVSYTSGAKNDFSISGLETPLNNATDLVTDLDFDNLYIIDSGNNRIVVIDKNGNFVNEYSSATDRAWNDVRGIAVSPNETVMYVLNGSRVYEVTL